MTKLAVHGARERGAADAVVEVDHVPGPQRPAGGAASRRRVVVGGSRRGRHARPTTGRPCARSAGGEQGGARGDLAPGGPVPRERRPATRSTASAPRAIASRTASRPTTAALTWSWLWFWISWPASRARRTQVGVPLDEGSAMTKKVARTPAASRASSTCACELLGGARRRTSGDGAAPAPVRTTRAGRAADVRGRHRRRERLRGGVRGEHVVPDPHPPRRDDGPRPRQPQLGRAPHACARRERIQRRGYPSQEGQITGGHPQPGSRPDARR